MTDPESREPVFRERDAEPLFIYQVEYPLGSVFCVAAKSFRSALDRLSSDGIVEPFMIRRAGLFVEETSHD